MVELMSILTQTEILLESDMLKVVIYLYAMLGYVLFVSFINIYSVDKYEFQNNLQMCFEFKIKIPFIIMYSKEKHIISKKTFILEIIGYTIGIFSIICCIVSFWLSVIVAFRLLIVFAVIILTFGCVTGDLYRRTKKN